MIVDIDFKTDPVDETQSFPKLLEKAKHWNRK